MDMLLSADSLSFQEMLDLDIKSEIDTVLGGHNDFSSFNFGDLPPLDIDDTPSDLNMWFTNSSTHSNSNFNIDFIGSEAAAMMVNPNSVMPLTLVTVPTKPSPPTILQKSPSPALNRDVKPDLFSSKKDSILEKKPGGKTLKVSSPLVGSRSVVRSTQTDVKSDLKTEIKSLKTEFKQQQHQQHSVLNIRSAIQKQLVNSTSFNGLGGIKVLPQGRKHQFGGSRHFGADTKSYPKPAYSYSCLIAMALKNSRTGSLPVSEIYNFMCEHFPYFKTAPNGWKNSVRHNLSLNKCFEKIEKPAVSGAQRKGCLWAMNPAKISKMDEEVQKWSRKDPSAIRKAMINPEHLEALERGELKFNCRGDTDNEDCYGDSSADTEEEEDGSDVEVEDRTELEEIDFVNVGTVDDECGFDIEVSDTLYEQDVEDSEAPTIKIEMEVVDDDILAFQDTPSKKRSRSIVELDENFTGSRRLYQLQTSNRRKTAYLIKNDWHVGSTAFTSI